MTEYPYVFVDSQAGLEQAALALTVPTLLPDNGVRVRRGQTRLCLLQISSGGRDLPRRHLEARPTGRTDQSWPELTWSGSSRRPARPRAARAAAAVRAPCDCSTRSRLRPHFSAENNVSLAYLLYQLLGGRSDKAHQTERLARAVVSGVAASLRRERRAYLPALAEILTQRPKPKTGSRSSSRRRTRRFEPSREPPPPLSSSLSAMLGNSGPAAKPAYVSCRLVQRALGARQTDPRRTPRRCVRSPVACRRERMR